MRDCQARNTVFLTAIKVVILPALSRCGFG
jgi:hypothetical protein